MQVYAGSVLFIHMDSGIIKREPFPESLQRRFLGGRGIGVHYVAHLVRPRIDPLDPANVLVAAAGPLTGSGIPLGSRYDIVAKSPLSGTLSSANSGGQFGTALKRSGVDALVIAGASSQPTFLWIHDGEAELRDGTPYWGMSTSECTTALQRDLGEPGSRVACIGPAGEHLCRFASVMNETARAAGRGGLGAVMGSKGLKAIVVKGGRPREADQSSSEVRRMVKEALQESGLMEGGLHQYGTANLVNFVNDVHFLPARNFQDQYFPEAEQVSGEVMARTILKGKRACYACPIACGRITEVDGKRGEGPEFESIWALGPDCGIDDLAIIARANYLCNDLGLDTISCGSTIACAIEMSERGYIAEELQFGDGEMVLDLVEKIAFRKELGDSLAEGSYRFALQQGHPELSMTVKGQEIPAYDPRGLQGQGLGYATSVRGACHVYGNMIYPELLGIPVKLDPDDDREKAFWTVRLQNLSASLDSLGICLFSLRVFSPAQFAEIAQGVTGIPMDEQELLCIGERIWNIQKVFNTMAGYTDADDTLPARLQEGKHGWRRQPLLGEYYRLRGWDARGHPESWKLAELGIERSYVGDF